MTVRLAFTRAALLTGSAGLALFAAPAFAQDTTGGAADASADEGSSGNQIVVTS